MLDAPYADARVVAGECLEEFLPPERLSVPRHAAKHRLLDNAGGGTVGRWRNEKVPYTVQPAECLDGADHLTVCVVGPGQVAKTVIAENWLLRSVDADPGNLLWYMQDEGGLEAYVKARINPMIDLHEDILRRRIGKRAIDDSLHYKNFGHMRVEFLAATPRSLINKSAPRIVADEIDGWQLLGDPKVLLDVRRQTFGRQSMLLATSHPDKATGLNPARDWTSGIMSIYADSDRRLWWWPCPHCGAWSSPCPTAARRMVIAYPDDAPLDVVEREAHLVCPVNGCVVADHEREAMNLAAYRSPFGGWLGLGQEISEGGTVTGDLIARDTAGFWIVGAMSPFVIGGIGGLARARVKAERDRDNSGEDATLRQVIVKQWGEPYNARQLSGRIEAQTLVDRAEEALALGMVPEGVRFLVAFVDIQAGRFDYMVRGFGVDGESWVILRDRVLGEPATRPDDWDRMLETVTRPLPLADGSGRVMAIRAVGYDSGGQPGVTQQAYAAYSRWRRLGQTKLLGKVGGREVHTVLPTKGRATPNAPRLMVNYPDTMSSANKKSAKGAVPVAQFNPNQFKDDLAGQLQAAQPGPWYIHFPAALKSAEPPHAFFEEVVAEHLAPSGRWEKVSPAARNEALDQLVGTHVMAHLHGLSRLDWKSPPAWAETWDRNPSVTTPAPEPGPPGAGPDAPAAAETTKQSAAARLADRLA